MLNDKAKSALEAALAALRAGDGGPWAALAPLLRLQAEGMEVSIDFTAEERLGAALVLARPATPTPPDLSPLTPRQAEVARLLGQGASNKAIARALGLSPATVKDHVHAVLQALGLKSRAEVAAWLHGRQSG